MPNLITTDFFKGRYSLPNTGVNQSSNMIARYNEIITSYEKDILEEVFGTYFTTNMYDAGTGNALTNPNWDEEYGKIVTNGMPYTDTNNYYQFIDPIGNILSTSNPLVAYLHYIVLEELNQTITNNGIETSVVENNAKITHIPMMVKMWNDMVNGFTLIDAYLQQKKDNPGTLYVYKGYTYDPLDCTSSQHKYFTKINEFGL